MKHTFRVLFFLKRDKQRANGNLPVFCRITVNKQEARFNLKVDVNPLLWDVKTGKAAGRSKEAVEINAVIDKTKSVLFSIYNDFLLNEENITAEKIKNHFLGDTTTRHYLLEQFLRHNEDVEKLIGINKSKATYQKYECTRKHLTNFIKEKYNLSDISFKEINHLFISDFEVFLLTACGCNPNTTAKFIQFFKRIVLIARNNGWIHHDPFVNYKITIKKVDRGYLTQEELDSIMEKRMPNKRLEQVKDVFVFASYTGMAYIDVKNLREKQIRTSFDGNLWIMAKRQKTGVSFNIPLLDVPQKILDKYKNTLPNEAVLPVLSNQKTNSYLKEIADVCGIDKNLSFHVARHTFSTTVTLAKGVPIESVSKMLGHTNIKTTQIYARITDSKVGHDMAELAEKMNKKKTKQPVKPATPKNVTLEAVLPKPSVNSEEKGLDLEFDSLHLDEKLDLLNIEYEMQALANNADKLEKKACEVWNKLSDKAKHYFWNKSFEKSKSVFTIYQRAIN